MTGYELQSSGIGSNCSANLAITTRLLCKGIVPLTCITGSDPAALLSRNCQQIYLFGLIQSSQTGGQPNSDAFLYRVSE